MAFNDDKDTGVDQRTENTGRVASISSGKDSKDVATVDVTAELAAQWVEGTEEEKRLRRKLDWRILPCTWVLYLLGYLDRANIG